MKRVSLSCVCALSLLTRCAPIPAKLSPQLTHGGPPKSTATLVVLQGADTVAVEWLTRTPDLLQGHGVHNRTLTYDYALSLDSAQSPVRMVLIVSQEGLRPDTSVFVYGSLSSSALPLGTVPYWGPIYGLIEQLVVRARFVGGREIKIPLNVIVRHRTGQATISFRLADSVWMDIDGLRVDAIMDRNGGLQDAWLPNAGLRVHRVSSLSHTVFAIEPRFKAPHNAPYRSEDLTIDCSDGAKLSGTLTLPIVRDARRIPAVVLLHGSASSDRNNSAGIDGALLFRQLADTLSRRGIAVLRYDKRGFGAVSPGQTPTLSILAADAKSALALLKARNDIDRDRLAVVGLSEGGVIGPIVASQDTALRGLVLLNAPGITGWNLFEYQVRAAIERIPSILPSSRDSVYEAEVVDERELALKSERERVWLEHDPIAVARRIKTPVLMINASSDLIVPARSAVTLLEAFRQAGNHDVTATIVPNLNHVLLRDSDGDRRGWTNLPSFLVPGEIRGLIVDWLVWHLAGP
jgi:pimeloyl-ACP methyl ester carboxylesterase